MCGSVSNDSETTSKASPDDPAVSQTGPKVLAEVMRVARLNLEMSFPSKEGKQLYCHPGPPHCLPLRPQHSYQGCLISQGGPSVHVGVTMKGLPSKIPGAVSVLFL